MVLRNIIPFFPMEGEVGSKKPIFQCKGKNGAIKLEFPEGWRGGGGGLQTQKIFSGVRYSYMLNIIIITITTIVIILIYNIHG